MNRVHEIMVEMLNDRGYTYIEYPTENTMNARNSYDKRILVYFVMSPKVSIKKIKLIKDIIEQDHEGYSCLIIVCKGSITSFARQFITTDVNNLMVQVFSEKELSFNITKHELVPIHELLTEQETTQIKKKYKTTLKHFPNMLITDPVAKYYGYVPGNLIRIIRKSPTAGEYVSYRVVV
jgi:DNA-directed RNA polymerase I, II, and III subunit RPABC1